MEPFGDRRRSRHGERLWPASLARDGASSFSVDLKGFRLIDNDLAQATASGRVTVNRAANGKVQLAGAVIVDRAQISPNPPVATGVVPMDVVEIHKPDMTDERFAAAPPPTRDAPLGLTSRSRRKRIFVKGRGLNLELSLDAHVGGSTEAPLLTGAARVVRGDYDFAGQRFQFDDRGVIDLGSTAESIRLSLTATRDDPALTAVIKSAGRRRSPTSPFPLPPPCRRTRSCRRSCSGRPPRSFPDYRLRNWPRRWPVCPAAAAST